MLYVFNLAHFAMFLIVFVHGIQDPYQNQPRIIVENGHLVFQSGVNNDISFRPYGSGKILINNQDLQDLVKKAQSSVTALEQFRTIDATALTNQLEQLKSRLDQMDNVVSSFRELQNKVDNLTITVSIIAGSGRRGWSLSRLTRKVVDINRNLSRIAQLLNRDECSSNPCQNGGSCFDNYNGFTCQCTDAWQGSTCSVDVDECSLYRGTKLGCQNGGTCVNKPGGYECLCTPNFHGFDCNTKHDDCSKPSEDNHDLCQNGHCISYQRTRANEPSYKCVCDPGWTINNRTGACDTDINECDPNGPPHCSVNPRVSCFNTRGGFHCGHCPPGYEGNGQSCYDINECMNNNGGCSLMPYVTCENTVGSFRCGRCPPGYIGDGRNCVPGVCSLRNGDCHPLATCVENNAVYAGYRECRCPAGYNGDGIGPNGCQQMQPGQLGTACDSNPCVHGSCIPQANSFSCICYSGFTGSLCATVASLCSSNPCKNGGTCTDVQGSYTCYCLSSWQGPTCEQEVQNCGGTFVAETGAIRYPINTEHYPHNTDCTWTISTTIPGKILSLHFTYIQAEPSPDCRFDFIQINDGDSQSSPILGNRLCGSVQDKILKSTHGTVYLWFHSDATMNSDGFEMTWNTTDPVCGGNVTAPFGTISSPGYPGQYPNNRDCFWYLQVLPGKRIQLQFSHLAIESHDNCSFDFVRVYDGANLRSGILDSYCTSTVPEPLTTSGSHAIIHFHSDQSKSDKGFNLVYSSVPGIPGCGGILTADRGVVVSPNFPNRYLIDMNCEWLIRVHPEDKIELTFESFHLERHSNCKWDYIEVRDGKDENAELKGRFCGRTIPPKIISKGNNLWLKFKSDSSFTYDGFKLNYITTCGGHYSSPTGLIQSPYFPDNYPRSRVCTYDIQIPVGRLIHLEFLHFDIEEDPDCHYDCLEVYDNGSPNGTLLGQLSGNYIPEPITSTYNHLLVVFRTDNSQQFTGFQANYSGIEIGCGGVLTERNGVISTPSHPTNYPHGTVCNWLIRAPEGYVVQLSFNFFDIEFSENCTFDYVEIKDSDYHQLGRYCGTRKPPSLTSFDRELYVKFSADDSVSRDGFLASYLMQDYSRNCGGNYKREYGIIKSPGYPNHYPHNSECIWTIEVPTGRQIRLNFTAFSIESHSNCRFDSLEIRNGLTGSAPLIKTFCGNTITPNPIISHHHQLYLKFTTDSSSTAMGFQIIYDSASTGCGGVLTAESGTIQSPSYPSPYSNNAECQWVIRVAKGSRITLVVVDLDIEPNSDCEWDFIRVHDGNDDQALALTPKLCNTRQNPGTIVSSQNVLYIVFRTDASVSGRGFNLAYHANCNNILSGIRGVIESPNFPSFYPHNYNCTWEINALEGNNISIAFSTLMLENDTDCQFDRIELLQQLPTPRSSSGPPPSPQSVAKFCGTPNTLPFLLINSSKVIVRFVSDESQSQRGFRLEYAVRGCVGEFRKQQGSITSPNYPNGYSPLMRCEWHIITEPGSIIHLSIIDMDIEGSQGCIFDTLKVYDGLDDKANKLHDFCHKGDHMQTTLNGNKMMLRFHSDYTITGRGFKVNYYASNECEFFYRRVNQGTIVTKNYPNNYPNGTICTYWISVPENHLVEINFHDFDIPSDPGCVKNYVMINEGNRWDMNRKTIFKHCGSSLPANYTPVISKVSSVQVLIFTSENKTGRGFKATFKAACGAQIKVNGYGYLTSPNYPHGSVNHYNCSWVLTAPEGERVSLTLTEMVIHNSENCSTSYMDVRDGHTQDASLIGRYCGHAIPAPFISRGNNLFISLHNYGLFKAAYTNAINSCGARLTAPEGVFYSPSYPANYPPSSSCIWVINSAPGNKIELSFTLFMLEENENCNTDYLEVHENGPDGRSLGRYCGNDIPVNISAVNKLWIKFRSDDSGSGVGFQANYVTIHGIALTGNVGEVASPMFPLKNYLSGTYTWTITVDVTLYVSLEFLTFEVDGSGESYEHCNSYIEVFDGEDDRMVPLRESLCGIILPDSIVSSTNVVTLKYKTIGYKRSRWHLRWTGVNSTFIATPPPPTLTPGGTSCGTLRFLNRSSNATETSPGYPTYYPANLNCTWIFIAPLGRKIDMVLNVSLNQQSIGACYDAINVYDAISPGTGWYRSGINDYCRREQRLNVTSAFQTGTRIKKVTFTSGNLASRRYFYGLSIYAYDECGGILTGSNKYLDHSLAARRNGTEPCQWLIQVRRGRTIRITFEIFNIPSDLVSCSPRYLHLRNGGHPDSPNLGAGKFCGGNLPPVLESSSNKVHITLQATGGNLASPMFKLKYEEISLGCGGQIHLNQDKLKETVSSPNYPNDPPHDVQCEWVVFSPPGTAIRLDVENLSFESGKCSPYNNENSTNYLEAYDGGTMNAHQLKRICNHESQSSLHATGNVMLLRFVSSQDVAHAHFTANVTIAECGGIKLSPHSISSPNFPKSYGNKIRDCEWIIKSPHQNLGIIGNFTSFDLPDNTDCSRSDYVEVRDTTASGELIGRYCGQMNGSRVSNFSSLVSQIYIKFHTNGNSSRIGFSLKFIYQIICGQQIQGGSGVIKSPRFPQPYPKAQTCRFSFYVDRGRRIKLTFDNFNLPRDQITGNCTQYIKIVRGALYRNQSDIPLCGNEIDTIESFGNNLFLILITTTGLGPGEGFQATYTTNLDPICDDTIRGREGFVASYALQPREAYNGDTQCNHDIDASSEEPQENVTLALKVLDYSNGNDTNCNVTMLVIQSRNHQRYETCDMPKTEILLAGSRASVRGFTRFYGDLRYNISYKTYDCGGFFRPPVILTSPNFPASYPNNSRCVWIISSGNDEQLEITFSGPPRLGGSCQNANLTIRDGYRGYESPSVARFCAELTSPPLTFTSKTGSVEVILSSDGSVTSDIGFNASIVVKSNSNICGGTFVRSRGEFSSPNYPHIYPNNTQCEWLISLSSSYRVNISFTGRFDIENTTNCVKDSLMIEENRADNSSADKSWHTIERICGHQTRHSILSTTNEIRVTFTSDANVMGDGFHLMYQAVCGATYTDSSGTITSPGYPDMYDNSMECRYLIGSSSNDYITFQFDTQTFDIEQHPTCLYDSVKIYIGNNTNVTPRVYCGLESEDRETAIRNQGPLLIVFQTDDSVPRRGFMATYKISNCGGNLTSMSGVLTSPYYPSTYTKNLDCNWQITVPPEYDIEFRVLDIELEGSGRYCTDFLRVSNGNSSGASDVIDSYCDNNVKKVAKSWSNQMRVTFHSDYSLQYSGFKAIYRATRRCGGNMHSEAGTIYSPDYNQDGRYDENVDCIWRITGREGKVIKISFETFQVIQIPDVNNTTPCAADYLELRDGIGLSSPIVGRYCGTTNPGDIKISSNMLWVHFHSDMSNDKLSGFRMSYTSEDPLCGGLLNISDTVNTLTTPNYPLPHPPNIRCRWEFVSTERYIERMEISINHFDVPCDDAYLDVFIGRRVQNSYSPRTPYHYRYCGQHYFLVTHAARSLVLVFHAGSSTNRVGFSMTYKRSNCSRHYTEPYGEIYSPERRFRSGHRECKSVISASPGRTISLYFVDFYMRSSASDCTTLSLKIRDGSNESAPLLNEICNGNSNPMPVFTSGPDAFIHYTETNTNGKYFIIYTTTSQGQGCGGILRGYSGVFYSPFYPMPVNRTESCVWNIFVLSSHTMELHFEDFRLTSERGCESNYVEVYNGKVENDNGLISRFCGNDNPATVLSLTNEVLVKMVTNSNNTDRGFKISYRMNNFAYNKPSEIDVNTAEPYTVPTRGADLDLD